MSALTQSSLSDGGIAHFDGDFTALSEVYPSPRIDLAIETDPTSIEVTRRYMVKRQNYTPLTPDTPDVSYTQCYLTGEKVIDTLGADIIVVERIYNAIPASSLEAEDLAFQFPGITASASTVSYVSLGGVSFCSTTGFLSWTTGISAVNGDLVGIRYTRASNYTFLDGSTGSITFGMNERVRANGANQVPIRPAPKLVASVGENISSVFAANLSQTASRKPITRLTTARVLREYFLPGVSAGISDITDIKPVERFRVLGPTGQDVDTITVSTSPDATTWRAWARDGNDIVGQDSTVRRWKGNIHVRTSYFIRAQ